MDMLIAFVGMFIGVLLFVGFIVVYGRFVERHQPKSGAAKAPHVESRPIGEAPPAARPSIADVIMSTLFGAAEPVEGGASGLAQEEPEGLQPLATPCKPAKDGLARQGLGGSPANDLQDITPAEVRAIIRQQARAEAIVAILKAAEAGKVKSAGDQAGLIEAVSGAARSSRPGPYTSLKAIVDELRGKPKVVFYNDLREKIEAEVRQ